MSDNHSIGMMSQAPNSLPANVSAVLDALRRGDLVAAQTALASASVSADQVRTFAEGLMRRRRWSDASWAFSQIQSRDAASEMKRRLAGNLASFQTHRPEIYEQLITLPATDSVGIGPSASGRPTIIAKNADGNIVSLSGGPDPLAAAERAATQLKEASPHGDSIGLCGLGDGYLLQILAQRPPALFMDMQQAVFVLEPQPQVLFHALMIHDYTGKNGPIEAERFRWFVGAEWSAALRDANERIASLGLPTVTIQQGLDGPAVQEQAQVGIRELLERDVAATREIENYYAQLPPRFFAELFGPNPSRPPRVMLLTTRFSTVLQFSTRDTADAFRALGWDARVVIEQCPSHRLYQHAIRRELASFKPDLIFQIDHLRHEHGKMFPANLPFVCWAQDHLSNLITPIAGRQIGSLDFVLTDNTTCYAQNYAYPTRQLISVPKLTAAGMERIHAETDVEQVVYVSNASRTPQQLLTSVAEKWDGTPRSLDVLLAAAEQMLPIYLAGDSIGTYSEVRAILQNTIASQGVELSPQELLDVSKWLTHPFNDVLYRQQALRWVTASATRLGLSVGLYGAGWDQHPDLASFARGPIQYGAALNQLTRSAAINLQIVPYFCLHQRLLDGLVAGGFFIVRQNPNDIYPQRLLNFVEHYVGGDVRTTRGVREGIDPAMLPKFEALLTQAGRGLATTGREDFVAFVRDWASAGLLQTNGEVLPQLSEISFDNEHRVEELLRRFATNREARNGIAAVQRAAVEGRLTYTAGMARVQRRIAELLRETANSEELRKCA